MVHASRAYSRSLGESIMKTKKSYLNDPDETEGRKLYRAHANALAKAQVGIARRKVSLRVSRSDDDPPRDTRLVYICL